VHISEGGKEGFLFPKEFTGNYLVGKSMLDSGHWTLDTGQRTEYMTIQNVNVKRMNGSVEYCNCGREESGLGNGMPLFYAGGVGGLLLSYNIFH
jgi:hypothetical protein